MGSLALLALGGSLLALPAASMELPQSPEQFIRAFNLSLGEESQGPLLGLFQPDEALRAQARSLFQISRGFSLAERRLYSAPDQGPLHALIKLRLDNSEKKETLVLGLRLGKSGTGWLASRVQNFQTLKNEGTGRKAELRFEVRVLEAMMDGVSDFVLDMTKLYGPAPQPTGVD